jgi:hypothetical protein
VSEPGWDEEEEMRDQAAAEILLVQVVLRLLGEARLRGDFGAEEDLAGRAAAIADELTDGAPSPNPRRETVEARLIRPDRIALSAAFSESSAVTESLMLDGTLYGGGVVAGFARVPPQRQERELSAEERADRARRKAEREARMERARQFTASAFVRAIVPPPQPDAAARILAVLLYEDGFYVESTHDKDEPEPLPADLAGMTPEQIFALRRADGGPEITIADDLGTEYFPSGGAGSGGVRVSHASQGFAPAPPPEAHLLRVMAGAQTLELHLPS